MTEKTYQELETEKDNIINAMELSSSQADLLEEVLAIESELIKLETY